MRALVMLSVVFAVALAAPTGKFKSIELVQSAHAEKRSIGHGVAIVDPSRIYISPATTLYTAPSAISHQSREDVRTSQLVVSGTPVVSAPTVQAFPLSAVVSPVFQAPSVYTVPAKTIYTGGAAVSHQSRVDTKISSLVALEPADVANPGVVQSVPTVVENLPSVLDARSVYVAPASTSLHQPIVYSTLW